MNRKTKKQKNKLVIIPFIIGISLLVSFVIASILEHPTNRGMIYTMFALIAIMGSILVPIPCGISSTIGVINAIKLKKQGENTIYLIVIGILNIVVSFIVAIFWLRAFVPIFVEVA